MAASSNSLNLLLDIDGTLAITDRLYLLAFQDLMRPFGYTEVDEAWFEKHVAGKVDAEVFSALLPAGTTAEMIEATSRQKDALFVQKVASVGATVVPGLGGVLQMARRCGWRCIAVTNAQRGGGQAVLDLLRRELGEELAGMIEDLVVGCECARAKPLVKKEQASCGAIARQLGLLGRISRDPCSAHSSREPEPPKPPLSGGGAVSACRRVRLRAGNAPGKAAPRPVPGGDAAAGRGARALHRLRGLERRHPCRRRGQGRILQPAAFRLQPMYPGCTPIHHPRRSRPSWASVPRRPTGRASTLRRAAPTPCHCPSRGGCAFSGWRRATGCPATASGALASRLHSRRFHLLWPIQALRAAGATATVADWSELSEARLRELVSRN